MSVKFCADRYVMNWLKRTSGLALLMLCALPIRLAHSTPLEVINELRNGGCSKTHLSALPSDKLLQHFTERLARGASETQAQQQSGYLYQQLTTLRISGATTDTQLRAVLKQHYCPTVMKPDWQQVGSSLHQQEWWIVLAQPHALPSDARATAQQVLTLVNQARAQSRRCGSQRFAATTALTLNAKLNSAAQVQANDMAKHQFMDHVGSDGSKPPERISKQGYSWKNAGENIAAGAGSAAEVVAGWLNSPGHCANIMNSNFTEMGLAFAINQRDDYAVYLAQTFAQPK